GMMGGMMGGMGGMMGGMGGMPGRGRRNRQSQADLEKQQKEEVALKRREMAAKLAGGDQPPSKEEEEKEKAEAKGAGGPPSKETVKGLRWVAITGVLDHDKMRANYREALKNPAVAHPLYARLDVQRQVLDKDGNWSKWEDVDAEENLKILDNLPEEDDELTLDNVRPDNLNDPLPFLKQGLWEKVHIASLVPKERKKIDEPAAMPMGGMMGGMMGGKGGMMMGGSGGMRGMGGYPGMMGGSGGMRGMGGASMMGGKMGMGMMGGKFGGEMGMMGGFGGGGGDVGNFWKSEEKR